MTTNWVQRMTRGREERMLRWEQRIVWLGGNIEKLERMTNRARLRLAAQLLRDRIVINISIPVNKQSGRRSDGRFSRTVVTERSKPGEFPRADTTRLMKDIYYEMDSSRNVAIIGTTLDYGLILEVFRDRSFIIRTVMETQQQIQSILMAKF